MTHMNVKRHQWRRVVHCRRSKFKLAVAATAAVSVSVIFLRCLVRAQRGATAAAAAAVLWIRTTGADSKNNNWQPQWDSVLASSCNEGWETSVSLQTTSGKCAAGRPHLRWRTAALSKNKRKLTPKGLLPKRFNNWHFRKRFHLLIYLFFLPTLSRHVFSSRCGCGKQTHRAGTDNGSPARGGKKTACCLQHTYPSSEWSPTASSASQQPGFQQTPTGADGGRGQWLWLGWRQ